PARRRVAPAGSNQRGGGGNNFVEAFDVTDLFLNRELVKAGLAWHYKQYSDDKRLTDDEDNARLKKLGLWVGSHKPIAPWDWRKLSKVERDEYR
ncbi:MAG TPA: hypothetical protein EYG03_02790, partial [Planctomycetes bacterium]|nr:hypothetical protein [Planctomycetota bacterium]